MTAPLRTETVGLFNKLLLVANAGAALFNAVVWCNTGSGWSLLFCYVGAVAVMLVLMEVRNVH